MTTRELLTTAAVSLLILSGLIVLYSIKAGDKFDWMVCGVFGGSVSCFLLTFADRGFDDDDYD